MSNDIHDSPSLREYVLIQEIHIKSLLVTITMIIRLIITSFFYYQALELTVWVDDAGKRKWTHVVFVCDMQLLNLNSWADRKYKKSHNTFGFCLHALKTSQM